MVLGQFSQWSSGLHVNFCRADRSSVDVDQLKTPVKVRDVQVGLSGPVVARSILLGFQLPQGFHIFLCAARTLGLRGGRFLRGLWSRWRRLNDRSRTGGG